MQLVRPAHPDEVYRLIKEHIEIKNSRHLGILVDTAAILHMGSDMRTICNQAYSVGNINK